LHKKITIQQSGDELIVIVDDGGDLIKEHKLAGGDWDGLNAALLTEGCVERQITEALQTLDTEKTAIIIVTTER